MRNHAINPYMAPIVSVVFLFIAFFVHPDEWRQYLDEYNYAYLNFKMLSYFFLALLCIYLGVFFGNRAPLGFRKYFVTKSGTEYNLLLFPVVIFSLIIALSYVLYLYFVHDGYIFLVFQGQGAKAKELIAADVVNYSTIVHLLIPSIWWGWYRYMESRKLNSMLRSWLLYLLFFLTVIVIFILIVIVARYAMMPLFFGVFLVFMKHKVYDEIISAKHFLVSLRYVFLFLFFVLLVFLLLAISRGSKDFNDLLSMVLGYGPASFNRLALVLEGSLDFYFANTGVYVLPDPFFSILRSFMGYTPLDPLEVWSSEFTSVWDASLNGNMIWATQFGYIWNSLYYASFVYLFFYGFFFGVLYKCFVGGALLGILFYPLWFFSVFFIFGSLYSVIYIYYYLLCFSLLWFWERVIFNMLVEAANG